MKLLMPKKPNNPYELNILVDDYIKYYQLKVLPRYIKKYLKVEYQPLIIKHKGWHYFLANNFWDYPPVLIFKDPREFSKINLIS